jgi:hypothetical protein
MRGLHNLFVLFLILALPALACNFGAAPTAAPETGAAVTATETAVPPTQPPPAATATATLSAPTVTPLPEVMATTAPILAVTPKPTLEAMQPGATPGSQVRELRLDTVPYTHPADLFTIYPPVGWTAESGDASVSFEAPDYSGYIYVQVTNTGHKLESDAFEAFVQAREANRFADLTDYEEIGYEIDSLWGVAAVTKELTFDGVPQYVITYYDQYDLAIYTIDLWLDTDRLDAYSAAYDEIFETIEVNSSAVAELDTYLWIYTFTGPNNLFTIEVPIAWSYVRDEGANVIVDTFYAPDDHAVIQNVSYDDGTAVSKAMAGAFALELLKTYYASDIRITDDRVQTDGSERLTWHSRNGDYSGVSFFETRGTTFLLFTTMYDNPYEAIYLDVLNFTIGSYVVP